VLTGAFRKINTDGSGRITGPQIKQFLMDRKIEHKYSDRAISMAMLFCDNNGDKAITMDEFILAFFSRGDGMSH
jgi:hypothetical protein